MDPSASPSTSARHVTARAPGRVNLIGEHTDYNAGLVLPMAINRSVTAHVTEADAPGLALRSRQVPGDLVTLAWEELSPGFLSGWSAYVAGAVWALATAQGVDLAQAPVRGLVIEVDGDVPLGAGLSSSAAVECAVVTALASLWRFAPPRRELARIAQRAENEFVGVPTGPMDQVASMMAMEDHAVLFDVRADTAQAVPLELSLHDLALLVIDTRAAHALVDGGYAARRASCERAAGLLGVENLREVADVGAAGSALAAAGAPDELIRRMRHVVTENARVVDAVSALSAADFAAFGRLMDSSHASLRDDFEVSCPELDTAVEAAREAGALGARMTGGGFGGSAIALVPVAEVDVVAKAVNAAYASAGFASPRIWQVRPSAGAVVLAAG